MLGSGDLGGGGLRSLKVCDADVVRRAMSSCSSIRSWQLAPIVRQTLLACFYHAQGPHQGLDKKLIAQAREEHSDGNRMVVDERLVGLPRNDR